MTLTTSGLLSRTTPSATEEREEEEEEGGITEGRLEEEGREEPDDGCSASWLKTGRLAEGEGEVRSWT